MKQIEPLLTIKEVAKRLSVSPSTVRNKIRNKDWDSIPKPKVKIGNSWRWEKTDLEAFINGCRMDYKIADKKKLPPAFAAYMQ